jgi:hypothetical protein
LNGLGLELLLAKIVVAAGIVIGVTAAAERLGPRIGGLLAATPQLAVLSLIFFSRPAWSSATRWTSCISWP